MDPATATIQLTPEDLHRFRRFVGLRVRVPFGSWRLFLIGAFLACSPFFAGPGSGPAGPGHHPPPVHAPVDWLVLIFFAGLVGYDQWRRLRPPDYRKVPHVLQPYTFTVRDDGMFCRGARGETVVYWSAVVRFVETEQDYILLLTERTGHILPKHCFPTSESAAIFANQVRLHMGDRFIVRAPVVQSPSQAMVA